MSAVIVTFKSGLDVRFCVGVTNGFESLELLYFCCAETTQMSIHHHFVWAKSFATLLLAKRYMHI